MRTRRVAFTSVFTSLALVIMMSGPAAALDGERGRGRGTDSLGAPFSFRATGTGTGTDATGVFKYTTQLGTYVGDISCMTVETTSTNRTAVLGGTITKGPSNVGVPFRIQAYDGPRDFFNFVPGEAGSPCDPTGLSTNVIQKGRIALTDA